SSGQGWGSPDSSSHRLGRTSNPPRGPRKRHPSERRRPVRQLLTSWRHPKALPAASQVLEKIELPTLRRHQKWSGNRRPYFWDHNGSSVGPQVAAFSANAFSVWPKLRSGRIPQPVKTFRSTVRIFHFSLKSPHELS